MYRMTNVTYRYQREVVFEPLDLVIEAGEYVALMGENGSGKTTFLNLLAGFLPATRGQINFLERPLTEWRKQAKKEFYAHLGILFQETDSQLFNSTVYDELAFGPRQLNLPEREVQLRVNDCLALLKIEKLRQRVPYQLSGGEKKKVAFASLLTMNPEVYLLDEPFNGLTKEAEDLLKELLKKLQKLGKTIILSTHDYASIADEADSFLLFDSSVKRYSKAEIDASSLLLKRLNRY